MMSRFCRYLEKVFNDPLDKALEVFLSDRPLVSITKALPSSRTFLSDSVIDIS